MKIKKMKFSLIIVSVLIYVTSSNANAIGYGYGRGNEHYKTYPVNEGGEYKKTPCKEYRKEYSQEYEKPCQRSYESYGGKSEEKNEGESYGYKIKERENYPVEKNYGPKPYGYDKHEYPEQHRSYPVEENYGPRPYRENPYMEKPYGPESYEYRQTQPENYGPEKSYDQMPYVPVPYVSGHDGKYERNQPEYPVDRKYNDMRIHGYDAYPIINKRENEDREYARSEAREVRGKARGLKNELLETLYKDLNKIKKEDHYGKDSRKY